VPGFPTKIFSRGRFDQDRRKIDGDKMLNKGGKVQSTFNVAKRVFLLQHHGESEPEVIRNDPLRVCRERAGPRALSWGESGTLGSIPGLPVTSWARRLPRAGFEQTRKKRKSLAGTRSHSCTTRTRAQRLTAMLSAWDVSRGNGGQGRYSHKLAELDLRF
jgi:hypothetical protein